jgi:hypothetical protein
VDIKRRNLTLRELQKNKHVRMTDYPVYPLKCSDTWSEPARDPSQNRLSERRIHTKTANEKFLSMQQKYLIFSEQASVLLCLSEATKEIQIKVKYK